MESLLVTLITVIVTIGVIWGTSGIHTPEIYMFQTYMYILLSALIVTLTNQTMILKGLTLTMPTILVIFIFGLGLILTIHLIQNSVTKHLVWILFSVAIGLILSPIIRSVPTSLVNQNIIIVFAIILFLSLIALYDHNNYFASWGGYLTLALIVLIVFNLIAIFWPSDAKTSSENLPIYFKWINMAAIVIFSLFVLSDTQRLRLAAFECGTTPCIDYPTESMGLFLDAINLFTNMTSLRKG
jgi:FtsH-binding integral membrane protein